ncbi:hypothetical protein [Williamsia sp. CHRR-6]|uniref:hypothetical protein n=1 Tax=Williamsia sp. CHRR-6 TaxID=2835871 RepID=UPI001BD92AA7|nr:hypothetical protein [Williamsia sp. CHRR-6]MBT0566644.1 hypothetical protein [Williamsia sp. CHRR-6]
MFSTWLSRITSVAVSVACGLAVTVFAGSATAAPAPSAKTLHAWGVSLPSFFLTPPGADLLLGTLDYNPTTGTIFARLTLRGAPAPLPNGGPSYDVAVYGPTPILGEGGKPIFSVFSTGVPAKTTISLGNYPSSGQTTPIPGRVTFVKNTVEVFASDPLLRNQPWRYVDLRAIKDAYPRPFVVDGLNSLPLR